MENNTIYHFSIVEALLNNHLECDFLVSDVKKRGNFGLCTFNSLDGEGILYENIIYKIKSDGKVYIAEDNEKIPYASVTFFTPKQFFSINNLLTFNELTVKISTFLLSDNLFFAIKVHGNFHKIKVRSIDKQKKPYLPTHELIDKMVVFEYSNVSGFLIGFKCPNYAKTINVPGYHFHFINDEKTIGGHVISFEILSGVVEIDTKHSINVVLDNTPDFYTLDTKNSTEELLMKIEKSE